MGHRKGQSVRRQESAVPAQAASILDRLEDAVIALDCDWRFTYLNRSALRVLGKPGEELLGQCLWETHPELLGTAFERHAARRWRSRCLCSSRPAPS